MCDISKTVNEQKSDEYKNNVHVLPRFNRNAGLSVSLTNLNFIFLFSPLSTAEARQKQRWMLWRMQNACLLLFGFHTTIFLSLSAPLEPRESIVNRT